MSGVIVFLLFLALTLGITYWAARRTRSTDDFYAAGSRVGVGQNALALAGDFIAASVFLGITGIAALSGFNAIIFAMASLAAWPLMLFMFAEPLRALGKYTFADVLEYRLGTRNIKIYSSLCTVVTIFLLLSFQLAGAGSVVKLLFGFSYPVSVGLVGLFMTIYVLFGGMIATTWVQIIKCVALMAVSLVLLAFVLSTYNFDLGAVFTAAAAREGTKILSPGHQMSPFEVLSVAFAATTAIASLPQILIRFYTVKNAAAARQSVLLANLIIAFAITVFVILGFSAMAVLGPDFIKAADRGGNMAIPMLAEHYGGAPFLGVVAALTVATILAAVCGIVIAGSAALSHDLWSSVVRRGKASPREQLIVAKAATVVMCVVGVLAAIMAEGQNVFILSNVAGGVASGTVFPALILAIYWRGLTYRGTVAGMLVGLVCALGLIWASPMVQVSILHHAAPIVPLNAPAIAVFPIGLLVMVVVSLMTGSQAQKERYDALQRQMMRG